MIGVDTNVLLRAMVGDDHGQSPRARKLLRAATASGEQVFVNHVVLCEFAWVLDRTRRLARAEIAALIEAVLEAAEFEVDDRGVVEEAVASYKTGSAGFADTLIGVLNRQARCRTTFTFDRRAARLAEFSPVLDA
jgi:predicted nucleic-acid-binding protein